LVLLRLAGRANCLTKLPDGVHASNVVDKQSDAVRHPVFAGHTGNLKSSATLIRNFGKPALGVVVRFCASPRWLARHPGGRHRAARASGTDSSGINIRFDALPAPEVPPRAPKR
jgi:hypothetical protein